MNIDHRTFAAAKAAAPQPSDQDTGKVYLPEPVYEALPKLYTSVGAALSLGAVYIGSGHPFMVGYLAAGMTCVFAGIRVAAVRRKARSRADD